MICERKCESHCQKQAFKISPVGRMRRMKSEYMYMYMSIRVYMYMSMQYMLYDAYVQYVHCKSHDFKIC